MGSIYGLLALYQCLFIKLYFASFSLFILVAFIVCNSDNEAKLEQLEEMKQPYTFTSADLAKIVEVTPSLKTRISIIRAIAPRLVDPASKIAHFTGLFRFQEDKHTVEEILKARTQTLVATKFSTAQQGGGGLQQRLLAGGGRGGSMRRASAPGVPGGSGRGFGMGSGRGGGRGGRGMAVTSSAQNLQPTDLSLHSIKENASSKQSSRSSSNLPTFDKSNSRQGGSPAGGSSELHNTSMYSLNSSDDHDDVVVVTDDNIDNLDSKHTPRGSPGGGPRRTPPGGGRRRASAPEMTAAAMAAAAASVPGNGTKNGTGHADQTDSEAPSTQNNSPSDDLSVESNNPQKGGLTVHTSTPFVPLLAINVATASHANGQASHGGDGDFSPGSLGPSTCPQSLHKIDSKDSMLAGGSSRAESPATVVTATGEEYELKTEAAVIAPGFVITARAPQRGPTTTPRRIPSDTDVVSGAASAALSSNNSSGSNTPRVRVTKRGAQNKEKEKEKESTINPKIASLRNMFERNTSTTEGICGGIAAAGLEDIAGPPAAVLATRAAAVGSSSSSGGVASGGIAAGETGHPTARPPGRAPRQVSNLILARTASLQSANNSPAKAGGAPTPAALAALEAQAEIARGKIMRSQSASSDEDPPGQGNGRGRGRGGSKGGLAPEAVAAPDGDTDEVGLGLGGSDDPRQRSESFDMLTLNSIDGSGESSSRPNSFKLSRSASTSMPASRTNSVSGASGKVSSAALEAQAAAAAARLLRSNSQGADGDNGDGGAISYRGVRLRTTSSCDAQNDAPHSPMPMHSNNSSLKAYSTTTTPDGGSKPSITKISAGGQFSYSTNNTPERRGHMGRSSSEELCHDDDFDASSSGAAPGSMVRQSSLSSTSTSSESAANDMLGVRRGSGKSQLMRSRSDYRLKFGASLDSRSFGGSGSSKVIPPFRGGAGVAGGTDVAAVCAALLGMPKPDFLLLEEEGPMSGEAGAGLGQEFYSYRELVRRNYTKEYQGLVQTELERYLDEEEFRLAFGKDKVSVLFSISLIFFSSELLSFSSLVHLSNN